MTAKSNKISSAQSQTADTFGYKWNRQDSYKSKALRENTRKWLLERYCDNDSEQLTKWLGGGGKNILDAGCGAGFSALLLFGDHLSRNQYIGVDISSAVEVAKQRFKEQGYTGRFIQSDLFSMDIPDDSVDVIFSEGVLHHTDSVARALLKLTAKLRSGGRFLFYVYNKKSVVREFTDDYIREQIRGLSNDEAWETLRPLTKLGKALGELDVLVEVPEDVHLLGIPSGKINIQRLFYWHICKMFYHPDMDLEEMNHINFDWFRPLNCIRSSPEEVREYCRAAGLEIEHIDIQKSGITVVAKKN